MTVAESVAWAAGLFEGEGSIEIALPPRTRTGVRLHLNTTDRDVLENFKDVAGCGKVREVRAPSVVRPHWKTCWSWNIGQADQCRRLLNLWLPYLGQRRGDRARQALELLDQKEEERYRTCFCGKHFQSHPQGRQNFCCPQHQLDWNRTKMARA